MQIRICPPTLFAWWICQLFLQPGSNVTLKIPTCDVDTGAKKLFPENIVQIYHLALQSWILRCGGAACPVWREPPFRTNRATLLLTTVPCFDLYHRPLAWRCPLMDQCFRYWFCMHHRWFDPWWHLSMGYHHHPGGHTNLPLWTGNRRW